MKSALRQIFLVCLLALAAPLTQAASLHGYRFGGALAQGHHTLQPDRSRAQGMGMQ